MSDKKAIFLTFLIDLLFLFVVIYLHEYRMNIYTWFRGGFALLGAWYFIRLTFLFIISDERKQLKEGEHHV